MQKQTLPDDKRKLIIAAIKKTVKKNSVLPCLDNVYLSGEHLTFSDLETFVSIPFQVDGLVGEGTCVPASSFIDCLEMMKAPVYEQPMVTKNKETFTYGFKQYYGSLAEVQKQPRDRADEPLSDYIERTCQVAEPPYLTETYQGLGIVLKEGKRVVKLHGEDPNNYPMTHGTSSKDTDMFELGTLEPEYADYFKKALSYVSSDDLRPAMTGVQVADHIAATDAHRLYFQPITPLMDSFILPARAVQILLLFGATRWQVFADYDHDDEKDQEAIKHVSFLSEDGYYVTTRVIDARFPDWKVVVPKKKDIRATVTAPKEELMLEVKNAMKFCNKSTNMVVFSVNGKVTIASQDIDFDREYSNDLDFAKSKFRLKKDQLPEPFDIGFNGNFLNEILAQLPKKEPVTLELWGPTKAGIINDNYLIMPLMLKQ
jgi:DNA polymerase-3 subunit beta